MASNGGEWKTVSHKKPVKPKPSETFTIEKKGPTKKEPSAFDQFIRDPKKPKFNYNIPVLTAPVSEDKKIANGDHKKQAKKKVIKSPEQPERKKFTNEKSFEPDVRKVNVNQIRDMLEQSRIHFPDSKSIWLKDIVAYLNALIPYDVSDPLFLGHSANYPFELLDIRVRRELADLLDECPLPALQIFHEHCMDIILRNMTKQQLPTIGYIMAIQVLASKYPEITYQNIQRLVDHRVAVKSRPNVCLTVLWCTHQGIMHQLDLLSSFYLWSEVLFPVIELKSFSDFVTSSLEFITTRFGLQTMPSTFPSTKVYFSAFDFVTTVHGLPKQLTDRLLKLLPNLIKCVLRPNNQKLSEYFLEFLRRLDTQSRPLVLAALADCLKIRPSLVHESVDEVQKHPQSGNVEKVSDLMVHMSEDESLQSRPDALS